MKTTLLSVVAFVCVALTCASADTINFNFSTTPGNTNTANYSSDGVTITATANPPSEDLFFKNGGGDETGLGLANTSQNEISPGQSITFNISSLFSKNVTDLTLTLGSVQSGEGGMACDAFGTCVSFTSSGTEDILNLFNEMKSKGDGDLTITATSGNVLIDSLTATTTVPEPSSLLLLGTGVFAMAGVVRKRLFS
jgi:hypothetical protein